MVRGVKNGVISPIVGFSRLRYTKINLVTVAIQLLVFPRYLDGVLGCPVGKWMDQRLGSVGYVTLIYPMYK